MKKKTLFAQAALCLGFTAILFSCGETVSWKKSPDNRFEYRVIETTDSRKDAPTLDYGDEITLHYALRAGDKVIESSYSKGGPVKVILPTKMHRNIFEEALSFARPGDSLMARVAFSEVAKDLSSYKSHFPDATSLATFSYKILQVKTYAATNKEKETQFALSKGFSSLEEYQKEKQRIVASETTLSKSLRDNLQKKKAAKSIKLSSNEHFNYVLINKGNSQPVAIGDTVYFYYMAALEKEEKIFDNQFRSANRMMLVVGDSSSTMPSMMHKSVQGLQKGDIALIFVPSKWGYGEKGSQPVVPANADLALLVEIAAIKPKKPNE